MPDNIQLKIEPVLDLSALSQEGAEAGRKVTAAINDNSKDAGKNYEANIRKALKLYKQFEKQLTVLNKTEFTPNLATTKLKSDIAVEQAQLTSLTESFKDAKERYNEMFATWREQTDAHKKLTYYKKDVDAAEKSMEILGQKVGEAQRKVEGLNALLGEQSWSDTYDIEDQTATNQNRLRALADTVAEINRAYNAAGDAAKEFEKKQAEAAEKAKAKAEALAQKQKEAAEKAQAKEDAQIYTDLQKRQDAYDKTTASIQKYIDKAREETSTLSQVQTAISQVVNRMVEIESFTGPPVLPGQDEEYARLAAVLEELLGLYARLAYSTEGYVRNALSEKATLEDVALALEAVKQRKAELEAIQNKTDAQQQEYEYLLQVLPELEARYKTLKAAKDSASNQEALKKSIESVTASVSKLIKKLGQLSGHAIKSTFNSVRRSLTGMGGDANDTSKELQHLIRNIIKYGFGVRSIYFLYRRLRTAMVEALKDMAKFDTTGLGAAINQLSTSLQYLKSAWAAAFAPIVEYVTPVLVQLMDLLANVANAIAALFATLTGKGTVVKAVKQQKALAGALGNTGSAASDAAGKLAAFDELNIIGNDSGGGGGGGGGGGSGDLPDGSFIVETIEGELADLINADKWFEIGQLFADKLNSLTDAADKWINDVFRPWGVKWATNLGNFMNGFIYHYNWELLGKTFADGINAIFDTANTWFTTVNWSWFGTRVADGLLSAIDTVDWTLIGKTLANKLNKTIDFLYGFVRRLFTNGGARKIGDAIAEGVNNFFATIHWDNLGETLSNGFNGVFNVLNRFIRQYNWDEIGDMIANAFNTTIANLDVEKAGATLSTFVLKLFDQLDKIDLFAVGEKIGRFLTSIDWASIITKAIGNILELVSGIITGAFNGEYGAEIAMIIVTALGAQLALAFAKIKIAELIGGQFLAGVMKSAGASAGAAAGGEMASIASGLGGIAGSVAPILGVVAALGGVALMLKQSTDWLHEYNDEMHTLDSTVQEHIDSINLLKDQTEGYHEASKRQMAVYEVENQRVRDLADSYLNLFDENGKVKAGMEERADYYYNQLANALGLEQDQLKTLVEKNGDLKTAIEEVITAKTQDRAISAYLDEYQHALDSTKTAQENVTNAEADHKKAVEDAETAQKNYQKALDDYIAIGAEAGDTTGEYKKRLDDAIKANSKAQYAVKATSQEVDAANEAMVKINATAKFYEGYMAAIATNDTTLINAALKRMQDGFITAEEGDKESLKRQVDNMEEYYQLLLEEMQKGNPNVTQEMLDDAKEWVNTADKELAKLEKAGSEGMEDLRKGMSSKKQALIAEAERTGQSLARAYKSSLEGVLNGVNMGTPTASLPTYSYQSTSGKITPKRAGYARLATGAVLPPNDPFLAVVGDQKHGTNIEAPLSTIEDAVRNVVGSDSNNSSEIVQLLQTLIDTVRDKNFSISKREVGDAAISEINTRTKRTGNSPILG